MKILSILAATLMVTTAMAQTFETCRLQEVSSCIGATKIQGQFMSGCQAREFFITIQGLNKNEAPMSLSDLLSIGTMVESNVTSWNTAEAVELRQASRIAIQTRAEELRARGICKNIENNL